jgi:hypothetical protein
MPEPVWDKIGLELEGTWHWPELFGRRNHQAGSEVVSHALINRHGRGHLSKPDGSVRMTTIANVRGRPPEADGVVGYWHGEINTRAVRTMDTVESYLRSMHPTAVDLEDQSCGFHVHVSFPPGALHRLTKPEFSTFFTERWERWGTTHLGALAVSDIPNYTPDEYNLTSFWARLNGSNRYCSNTFTPNSQLWPSQYDGYSDRYTQLNFCSFSNHGTLECRLLPMFADVDISVSALRQLMDIYTAWLTSERSLVVGMDCTVEKSAGPPEQVVSEVNLDTVTEIDVRLESEAEEFDEDILSFLNEPVAPGQSRSVILVDPGQAQNAADKMAAQAQNYGR